MTSNQGPEAGQLDHFAIESYIDRPWQFPIGRSILPIYTVIEKPVDPETYRSLQVRAQIIDNTVLVHGRRLGTNVELFQDIITGGVETPNLRAQYEARGNTVRNIQYPVTNIDHYRCLVYSLYINEVKSAASGMTMKDGLIFGTLPEKRLVAMYTSDPLHDAVVQELERRSGPLFKDNRTYVLLGKVRNDMVTLVSNEQLLRWFLAHEQPETMQCTFSPSCNILPAKINELLNSSTIFFRFIDTDNTAASELEQEQKNTMKKANKKKKRVSEAAKQKKKEYQTALKARKRAVKDGDKDQDTDGTDDTVRVPPEHIQPVDGPMISPEQVMRRAIDFLQKHPQVCESFGVQLNPAGQQLQ